MWSYKSHRGIHHRKFSIIRIWYLVYFFCNVERVGGTFIEGMLVDRCIRGAPLQRDTPIYIRTHENPSRPVLHTANVIIILQLKKFSYSSSLLLSSPYAGQIIPIANKKREKEREKQKICPKMYYVSFTASLGSLSKWKERSNYLLLYYLIKNCKLRLDNVSKIMDLDLSFMTLPL